MRGCFMKQKQELMSLNCLYRQRCGNGATMYDLVNIAKVDLRSGSVTSRGNSADLTRATSALVSPPTLFHDGVGSSFKSIGNQFFVFINASALKSNNRTSRGAPSSGFLRECRLCHALGQLNMHVVLGREAHSRANVQLHGSVCINDMSCNSRLAVCRDPSNSCNG
jgi:hypothetical protein